MDWLLLLLLLGFEHNSIFVAGIGHHIHGKMGQNYVVKVRKIIDLFEAISKENTELVIVVSHDVGD